MGTLASWLIAGPRGRDWPGGTAPPPSPNTHLHTGDFPELVLLGKGRERKTEVHNHGGAKGSKHTGVEHPAGVDAKEATPLPGGSEAREKDATRGCHRVVVINGDVLEGSRGNVAEPYAELIPRARSQITSSSNICPVRPGLEVFPLRFLGGTLGFLPSRLTCTVPALMKVFPSHAWSGCCPVPLSLPAPWSGGRGRRQMDGASGRGGLCERELGAWFSGELWVGWCERRGEATSTPAAISSELTKFKGLLLMREMRMKSDRALRLWALNSLHRLLEDELLMKRKEGRGGEGWRKEGREEGRKEGRKEGNGEKEKGKTILSWSSSAQQALALRLGTLRPQQLVQLVFVDRILCAVSFHGLQSRGHVGPCITVIPILQIRKLSSEPPPPQRRQ
ncbi:uncharacterized protein LOC130544722 [Ursus arctos]|uniref:uncharacterized protein LOC130544722 n=1 Tax=Ursus arctos TaxID=9644 RepID=UPI00254922BE|nr:uncharacterized protein LOC130544722 [Ursus arctos]